MSLEQALAANTAALIAMTAALSAGVAAAPTPPAETKKPKAKAETAPIGPANEGDAEGTKYFLNTKHNSVYRILPGDPHTTMKEATEITGADFLARQAAIAAASTSTVVVDSKPSVAAAQTAAPDEDDPFADVSATKPVVITAEAMTAKLMELSKKAGTGREALMKIIKDCGVTLVREIPEAKRAFAHDAAVAALAALAA